jgi:hypothetical protein
VDLAVSSGIASRFGVIYLGETIFLMDRPVGVT